MKEFAKRVDSLVKDRVVTGTGRLFIEKVVLSKKSGNFQTRSVLTKKKQNSGKNGF